MRIEGALRLADLECPANESATTGLGHRAGANQVAISFALCVKRRNVTHKVRARGLQRAYLGPTVVQGAFS